MASDYLLELEGIKGESNDTKHAGCIDIDAFSWGFTNPGSMGRGGGGGTGKVQFTDINFSKSTDKATPLLVKAACVNQAIKKAVLYARKSTKSGLVDYYKVILTDAVVSSYSSGGNAGDTSIPHDNFSLNFTKFELEYFPQKADGSLEGAVTASWDRSTNA